MPGNIKLEQVHECIQGGFGWKNCHLHEFHIGDKRYGDPDVDPAVINERGTKSKLKFLDLREGNKFFYIYDFGDDWRHEVEIEAVLVPDQNGFYPNCIDGERVSMPD